MPHVEYFFLPEILLASKIQLICYNKDSAVTMSASEAVSRQASTYLLQHLKTVCDTTRCTLGMKKNVPCAAYLQPGL